MRVSATSPKIRIALALAVAASMSLSPELAAQSQMMVTAEGFRLIMPGGSSVALAEEGGRVVVTETESVGNERLEFQTGDIVLAYGEHDEPTLPRIMADFLTTAPGTSVRVVIDRPGTGSQTVEFEQPPLELTGAAGALRLSSGETGGWVTRSSAEADADAAGAGAEAYASAGPLDIGGFVIAPREGQLVIIAQTPRAAVSGVPLESGDVVLALNGEPQGDIGAFRSAYSAIEPGAEVGLSVRREGSVLEVSFAKP